MAPSLSRLKRLNLLEAPGCCIFQSIHGINLKLLRNSTENFTIRTIWGGWSRDVKHGPSLGKGVHVLFKVLYGGCHLAAWNSFFPTQAEQWVWRGSALFLTMVPIWGALWILWWQGVRSQRRALYLIKDEELDIIASPFFFTF
ncbi:hypothetical protein ASPWEDRAFT_663625 [Aspergillus wentii DTO 134E9]|uniref:Uncharacterized protein n=1 Tax=Aspergillus wentii DTO 134E9 TaxID=1073089 RepID=A0A1L9RBY1_ASPWE|nr:uncharacterized protein ASPWEDRAFT_663625 [Aspergillus wentii DTO 134E9]OJJ32420.1 hypothetical protein ASPWEDRAFT_663625 [Aspergillus wentii DTO 134E9]